jgi:uncharacterized protein (UPF0212 family)
MLGSMFSNLPRDCEELTKLIMKNPRFFCLIFAVLFLNVPRTLADDAGNGTNDCIVPFGGILWSDAPLQVLEKMRKIAGVTNVYIDPDNNSGNKINLLGIQDSKSLFIALTNALGSSANLTTYLNAEGAERKCPDSSSQVEPTFVAGPIAIAEMSFTLEVRFAVSPGLALKFPQNVLTDSEGGFDLPLVVDSVGLSFVCAHNDPRFNSAQAKLIQLLDILAKKYSQFDSKGDPNTFYNNLRYSGSAIASDKEGATFSAIFNPPLNNFFEDPAVAAAQLSEYTCDLNYQNTPYLTALNDAYAKFYEAKTRPKGPDQSGGL